LEPKQADTSFPGRSQPLQENPFEHNRELKYLREQLKACSDPSTKADLYLRYLAGCDFNPDISPDSIITFGEEDVTNLLSFEEKAESSLQVNKLLQKF